MHIAFADSGLRFCWLFACDAGTLEEFVSGIASTVSPYLRHCYSQDIGIGCFIPPPRSPKPEKHAAPRSPDPSAQ